MVVREGVDSRSWKPEEGWVFTVKSCYLLLQDRWLLDDVFTLDEEVVYQELWKSKAPAKVLAFSWTLFLDRIPTKVNLHKRRLLGCEESKRCVFCGGEDETAVHLFIHYEVIATVWSEVMRWLGFNFLTPPNLFIHVI